MRRTRLSGCSRTHSSYRKEPDILALDVIYQDIDGLASENLEKIGRVLKRSEHVIRRHPGANQATAIAENAGFQLASFELVRGSKAHTGVVESFDDRHE